VSDPKRLLGTGSDFERAVLGSALGDEAPPHLRKKLVVALGVGGAAVGTSTAAGAAAATTTKWIASMGLGKMVAVAAVSGGLIVGVAATAKHVEASRARAVASARLAEATIAPRRGPFAATLSGNPAAPSATAAPHESAPLGEAFPPSAPSAAPSTPSAPASLSMRPSRARPLERAVLTPSPVVAATPTPPMPAPAPARSDALLGELALLDRANAAMQIGDVSTALARLDEHDATYSAGPLAAESLALRIEAHAARKDAARVRELVDAFAARYPGHPYTHRLRALVRNGAAE
jgi:hypothetical protein